MLSARPVCPRRRIVLLRAKLCAVCALVAIEENRRWAWRMERGGDPWL